MSIELKLTPNLSDRSYTMDKNCLKVPTTFKYQDKNDAFTYNISYGLPIIGRVSIDTKLFTYYIGENATIEQLDHFIRNLYKNLQCDIVFLTNERETNSISYDPVTRVWCHKTDSNESNIGGTLALTLSPEIRMQFIDALKTYYNFAFVTIEGHKRLVESSSGNTELTDIPLSYMQ